MCFSILSSVHHLIGYVEAPVRDTWITKCLPLGSLWKAYIIMYFPGYGYVAASLLWLLPHLQLSMGLIVVLAFTSLSRDDDFN